MAGDISFRSQVSAIGYLVRVFRFGYSKSVVAPFRVAGGSSGWQVAGLIHSALSLANRPTDQRINSASV